MTHLRLTEPLLPWGIRTITFLRRALKGVPQLKVLELADKDQASRKGGDPWIAQYPYQHHYQRSILLSVEAEGRPMFCQVVLRGIRFPGSASVSIVQEVPVETQRDTLRISQGSSEDVIRAYASKIHVLLIPPGGALPGVILR